MKPLSQTFLSTIMLASCSLLFFHNDTNMSIGMEFASLVAIGVMVLALVFILYLNISSKNQWKKTLRNYEKWLDVHKEWDREWAVLCKGKMDKDQLLAFLDKWEEVFKK